MKSDVAKAGFLNKVHTRNVVPNKIEPLYYELLYEMGFEKQDVEEQMLTWTIAITFCRIYELIDRGDVWNEADAKKRNEWLDEIRKLQRELRESIRARRALKPEEEDSPDAVEELQAQIHKLIND